MSFCKTFSFRRSGNPGEPLQSPRIIKYRVLNYRREAFVVLEQAKALFLMRHTNDIRPVLSHDAAETLRGAVVSHFVLFGKSFPDALIEYRPSAVMGKTTKEWPTKKI